MDKNNLQEIKGQTINQWVRLNRLLAAYRYSTLLLAVTMVSLTALSFHLANRNMVVIALSDQEKLLFIGERKSAKITDADVAAISTEFLKIRYTWGADHGERIVKELGPITSEGLLQRIRESLAKNKAVLLQSTQDVIIRDVRSDNGKVFAVIDRVIALNDKMKIVSPLEVTLTLVHGTSNRYNPLGIYINELMEHEGE